MSPPKPRKDLRGMRFGRLTAVETARVGPRSGWLCQCECGASKAVSTSHLTCGRVRSCGCLRRESFRAAAAANVTHGMTGAREFNIWTQMRARCENPRSISFPNYGGRGIGVCERWQEFENFYADMGPAPHGTQIDRHPNNDGNYEPGNCRWATPAQNSRNRRNTHFLALNGVSKCITEWATDLGITATAIRNRIRLGWPVEKALTERKTR